METSEGHPGPGSGRRVFTVPNVISFLRIALIPVFFLLIVDPDTTTAGVVLFGIVRIADDPGSDSPVPFIRRAGRIRTGDLLTPSQTR